MKKKIDTKPFDRQKVPPKQNLFFVPFIWLFSWIATWGTHFKISKKNMKGLKPPFIVFATHHAFMDFLVTPLALFPRRANYISELEGFENYGEWLYRQAGCLGTRKFVSDIALVKNIKKVMNRKGILVIYPEARYANVGTSTAIPISTAKLVKYLDVPVVGVAMKGNYLQSPIWNLKKRKNVRLKADVEQLFTAEDVRKADAEEIQKKIEEFLTYDEYQWQLEQNIQIDYKKRAEGLEKVLYQCHYCGTEFQMETNGAILQCKHCDHSWEMTTLGQLESLQTGELIAIPDWYEWERMQVEKMVDEKKYVLEQDVKVESLPNAVNFIDLGVGHLRHDLNGFELGFTNYEEVKETYLSFSPKETFSVHTEYNYRNKGVCITLSTINNTYFLYPTEEGFNPTKIQFATEYLYQKNTGEAKKIRGSNE